MPEHLLPERIKLKIRHIRREFKRRRKHEMAKLLESEERTIDNLLIVVKDALGVPEDYVIADDDKLVEPTDDED